MTCPECRNENPPEAGRCLICGASLRGESLARTRLSGSRASGSDPPGAAASESIATPTRISEAAPVEGTGADPLAALLPGSRLGNRYEITAVLGRGGMGVVYRARDLTLERDVALKVIRPDLTRSPSILERFRREILLASKATHKNILRIHDLGECEGLSFISMAFVEGETLTDRLEREGPLGLEPALAIAIQIGRALEAAHEAGVVHRDLKPQNVLLDREGNAYIADFGLSRSLEPGRTMTETGMILGTVDYMSPEQARGETHDHRGDVYAFGLILYEMLTGTLPFRAESAISSMIKRVHEEAPKVSRIRRGVPGWLAGIIARALKRDPDARYQSAAEVVRDLERRRASLALRRLLRPRALLRAATALVVTAAVAAGLWGGVRYLVRERDPGAAGPAASLVLLPFRNSTGDPRFDWVRTGLPDLLRTDLAQAKSLRVVEDERVAGILAGLNVEPDRDLPPETLRRLAGVLGVENLLTGKLFGAGDRFRIEAAIQRVLQDTVVAGSPILVEGSGEESIFAMVDGLSAKVREGLGVSRGWGETDREVREFSTGSVEALRLYEEGIGLVRAGDHQEAARRLEEALERDADFALARAVLAETYRRLGYLDRAVQESEKAVQGIEKASPAEGARIRAVNANLHGDLAGAEEAYREVAAKAPNDAGAQFNLGIVLEEKGDLEGSLGSFRRVLEIDPKHPEGHFSVGRILVKLGNPEEALKSFRSSLALHEEAGNVDGRATVLGGFGQVQFSLGNYDEAMRYFQESLSLRERTGDRRGEGAAWNSISAVLLNVGRYDEAVQAANKAIEIGRGIGDPNRMAVSYSNLGDIFQAAGRPDRALEAYQESLKLVREVGDPAGLAWTLSSVGYINTVMGRYLEGYFFLKEALEQRRGIGDRREIVRSLVDIGFVEQVQGRYDEAQEYLLEGLALARELNDKLALAVLLANLSNIDQDRGDYGPALQKLSEASAAAAEAGGREVSATCLSYSGRVKDLLGDEVGARADLDQALTLAREIGNRELVAEIQTYRGVCLHSQGESRSAAGAFQEAREAAEAVRNHRLILLARLHSASANGSVAELEDVLAQANASNLTPFSTQAVLALARLNLENRRTTQALTRAKEVITKGNSLGQNDILFSAHALAGRILAREAGRKDEARGHFVAALGFLEAMLGDLAGGPRGWLLGREDTAAFASEAGDFFNRAGQRTDSARLAALLRK